MGCSCSKQKEIVKSPKQVLRTNKEKQSNNILDQEYPTKSQQNGQELIFQQNLSNYIETKNTQEQALNHSEVINQNKIDSLLQDKQKDDFGQIQFSNNNLKLSNENHQIPFSKFNQQVIDEENLISRQSSQKSRLSHNIKQLPQQSDQQIQEIQDTKKYSNNVNAREANVEGNVNQIKQINIIPKEIQILSKKNVLNEIINSDTDSFTKIQTIGQNNKFLVNQEQEQRQASKKPHQSGEDIQDLQKQFNHDQDNIHLIGIQKQNSDKIDQQQSIKLDINQPKEIQITDQFRPQSQDKSSNQEIQQIEKEIKNEELETNEEQFIDKEFPPTIESITDEVASYREKFQKEKGFSLVFKRVSDVIQNGEINLFFNDTTTVQDVKQGSLGDCYFVAVMIAFSKYPHIIKSIFKNKCYSKNGKYVLNFYKNGLPIEITIDDYLPCYPDSRGFAFARSPNNTSIWPSLVEKAIAKMYEKYLKIEGGSQGGPNTTEIFMHLGGCLNEFYYINTGKSNSLKDIDDAWDKIFGGYNKGYLLTTGISNSKYTGEKTLENGLVANHAYCILEVKLINNLKLIKLKNTWAHTEWNLDWSDNSSKWTDELKKETKLEVKEDGIFWMSFEDFQKNFDHVNIAYFNPSYKISYLKIKNEEQLAIHTYELSLQNEEKDIEGYVILHQDSQLSNKILKEQSCCTSICVYEINEENSRPSSLIGNSRNIGKMVYSQINLQKGKRYKILMIADFVQSQSQDLVLSFYASKDVNLQQQNLLKSNNLQLLCDYIDELELSHFKLFSVNESNKLIYEYQNIFGCFIVYTIRNETKNKTVSLELQFSNEGIELLKESHNYNIISKFEEIEKNRVKIVIPSRQNIKLIFKQSSYPNLVQGLGYSKSIKVKSEYYPTDEEIEELMSQLPKESLIKDEEIQGKIYKQSCIFDLGYLLKLGNTTKDKKFTQRIKFLMVDQKLLNSNGFEMDENEYYKIIIPPETSFVFKFEVTDKDKKGSTTLSKYPYELHKYDSNNPSKGLSEEDIEELISKCPKISLIDTSQVEGEIFWQKSNIDSGYIIKFSNTTNDKKFIQRIKFLLTDLKLLNTNGFEVDEDQYYKIIIPPQNSFLFKFENTNKNSQGSVSYSQYSYELLTKNQANSEYYLTDSDIEKLLSKGSKKNLVNEQIDGEIYELSRHVSTGFLLKLVNTTKDKTFIQRTKFVLQDLKLLNSNGFEIDEKEFYKIIIPPQTSFTFQFDNTIKDQKGTFLYARHEYELV